LRNAVAEEQGGRVFKLKFRDSIMSASAQSGPLHVGYVEFKPLPYPTHLYRWSIAAIFYVRFVVEANGTIDNVQLIQAWTSGGKPIGDAMQDVTKGVIHWKAKPMLVGGQPIATAMIAPVSFFTNGSLDKDKPDSGMAIASDSPNSGQPVGNIPESGALSP
jgi:hypothetical protein